MSKDSVRGILRELGFSLFPLKPRTKKPAFSWKKYSQEHCSDKIFEAWAKQFDRFGLATGPVSGLVVVDTDSPKAEAWVSQNLPETPWKVKTGPKGDFRGYHRYYRFKAGSKVSNKARINVEGEKLEIDLRGQGGYVVAPGEPHYYQDKDEKWVSSRNHYEPENWPWCPMDVVPEFDPSWFPEPERKQVKIEPQRKVGSQYEAAKRYISEVPGAGKGSRNTEAYRVACTLVTWDRLSVEGAYDLLRRWNHTCSPPLCEKELLQCFRSAQGSAEKPLVERGTKVGKKSSRRSNYSAKPKSLKTSYPGKPDNSEALDSRTYTERHYLVSAWGSEESARTLSSQPLKAWRDPHCQAIAEALQNILHQDEPFEHVALSEELKRMGRWESLQVLEAFESEQGFKISSGSTRALKAFQDLVLKDDLEEILEKHISSNSTAIEIASSLWSDLGALISQQKSSEKIKTVGDMVREYLYLKGIGEPASESYHCPILSKMIGNLGGGDVVPICGPPKVGKTTLMMRIARDLGGLGIKSLVGQLEIREEQVCERELATMLGHYPGEMSQDDARKTLDAFDGASLDNLYLTTTGNSVESYRAEVYRILSKNPDIKFWFTDYNERIYSYGKRTDTLRQAEEVAHFVKETAKQFGVVAIILLQPNTRYHQDKPEAPTVDHIDYGKKWVKDAQALFFIHRPWEFNKAIPTFKIELHCLASRSSDKGVINLEWKPQSHDYGPWTEEKQTSQYDNEGTIKARKLVVGDQFEDSPLEEFTGLL